ncbi:MAG TPA: hypothetical protein VK989_15025 [Polyangia bacterium]|jgi:hypothetical protein|nr:hypothetical protein [Polyangia bacterium]
MNARAWRSLACVASLVTLATAASAQDPKPAAPPFVSPAAPSSSPAPTVKITLITVPVQKRVLVFWGKKRLGIIAPHQPLIIQRPRDSGPLDLIFQCEGFVPVQTRAYTFGDSKVAVKLTPLDQKNTLLGYREEVPEAPPAPDGGVSSAPPPGGAALPPPAPAAPPPGVAAPPPGVAPAPKAGPDAGVR